MAWFAISVFCISLVCIAAIFALKAREVRVGVHPLNNLRERADVEAIEFKKWFLSQTTHLETLPSRVAHTLERHVHNFAVSLAHFASTLAVYAHELADKMSHKHRFEERETKSEFLKSVSEVKNGNGNDSASRV